MPNPVAIFSSETCSCSVSLLSSVSFRWSAKFGWIIPRHRHSPCRIPLLSAADTTRRTNISLKSQTLVSRTKVQWWNSRDWKCAPARDSQRTNADHVTAIRILLKQRLHIFSGIVFFVNYGCTLCRCRLSCAALVKISTSSWILTFSSNSRKLRSMIPTGVSGG